jgi:hypothetical protein
MAAGMAAETIVPEAAVVVLADIRQTVVSAVETVQAVRQVQVDRAAAAAVVYYLDKHDMLEEAAEGLTLTALALMDQQVASTMAAAAVQEVATALTEVLLQVEMAAFMVVVEAVEAMQVYLAQGVTVGKVLSVSFGPAMKGLSQAQI